MLHSAKLYTYKGHDFVVERTARHNWEVHLTEGTDVIRIRVECDYRNNKQLIFSAWHKDKSHTELRKAVNDACDKLLQYYEEQLEIDASLHDWFNKLPNANPKHYLHKELDYIDSYNYEYDEDEDDK